MPNLYDSTTQTTITIYVESCEEKQGITAVENTSLDGTYYKQIIGSPQSTYAVKAVVDRTGKAALEAAEANGDVLTVTVSHGTYTGRIKSQTFSDAFGIKYFDADIILAKEVTA